MRRILSHLLVLPLVAATISLQAQFLSEPFDAGLNGWTSVGAWTWDDNGAADALADWNDRSRIRSASRGGAAAFASPEQDGQLISPIVDIPAGNSQAYLSFHTYFRGLGGNPRVRLLDVGGDAIFTETLLTNLQNEEETSAGYFAIIDISSVLDAGVNNFRVEFDVEGSVSFWLLDDINVTAVPPRRPTFPSYLGESLTNFGIPFVVDSTGAAAVPFELVADFLPGISESDRAAFRRMLGAVKKQSCVCDRIEVWQMSSGDFFDSNGQPLGDPSDILEGVLGSSSMNKVDGLDLNYYSYNNLDNLPAGPNPPLTASEVATFSPTPAAALKVAVLDTGLDLDHPDLNGFVFRDEDSIGDGNDDDTDCYPDNPLGWNFVDDNNNPNDNNGHGTHVAGIIADKLRPCTDCVTQIIPYKTHDSYGVGTLFSTTCATLQAAVSDGVKVINASWGFYGGTSEILKNAIDTAGAYGATFIAAAGNDSLNLIADPQFPATYPLANILAVGAVDTLPTGNYPLAAFSNFHADYVDIAAFGVAVESSLPGGGRGLKSGTSMSTPAVAAAAVLFACLNNGDYSSLPDQILADPLVGGTDLIGKILNQNVLSPDTGCPPPTNVDDPIGNPVVGFSVHPNPSVTEVTVVARQDLGPTEIIIYDAAGRSVANKSLDNFRKGETETFKINDLPGGQYLVAVAAGGRIGTQRLVKR